MAAKPAIFQAVLNGDGDEVRRLVKEGYDINEYQRDGSANQVTVIILLLPPFLMLFVIAMLPGYTGPRPQMDLYDKTALHAAVAFTKPDMVELLLELGANPELPALGKPCCGKWKTADIAEWYGKSCGNPRYAARIKELLKSPPTLESGARVAADG